jgi:hypothetical protein
MQKLFFTAIIVFIFSSCGSDAPGKLEDAFLQSVQKNDFKLLENFLPDKAFYNSLGDKMAKRSDEEILAFLDDSNEKVKQAWQNTIFNAAEKKIDLNKLSIKEVIVHDPFPKDDVTEAMVINYEYKGNTWDDIQFIIAKKNGKTYLLGIPNPTRAFSMSDPELRATNEAKAWVEMSDPVFKKNLQSLSDTVITAIQKNDLALFGNYLAYRGDDPNRQWKSAINLSDSLEKRTALAFLQRMHDAIAACTGFEKGELKTERESEGLWIVQPVKCGNKIFSLAFLRINGKLMLADASTADAVE